MESIKKERHETIPAWKTKAYLQLEPTLYNALFVALHATSRLEGLCSKQQVSYLPRTYSSHAHHALKTF